MIGSPQALYSGEAAGQGGIVGTSFVVMMPHQRLRGNETIQGGGTMTGTVLDEIYRPPR